MNKFARVAVPVPLPGLFDYAIPEGQDFTNAVGCRVSVAFGRRQVVGIVWTLTDTTEVASDKLLSIDELIDETPLLNPTLMQLFDWASQYYHHPIGDVVFTALPTALRKAKSADLSKKRDQMPSPGEQNIEPSLALNSEQNEALSVIKADLEGFHPFLLRGVTGSGKTEVYLQAIAEVLARGRQAMVLVPEIGLTPQTVSRFQRRFAEKVVVYHSGLTEKQRLLAWSWVASGDARIVIGTRSAVFMPFNQLGLIVIDESHDLSFKQQDGWRYSARDFAVMRANKESIPIVLGTATPTLESLYNVTRGRYRVLTLTQRAGVAREPVYEILDIRNQQLNEGLSPQLIEQLQATLAAGHQVLLFLNRRGFAPSLICHGCGWVSECHSCDARMTLHLKPYEQLRCHHCGATRRKIHGCPDCGCTSLMPLGLGTERLEQVLIDLFPDYGVIRIDRDTTRRKGELADKLDDILNNRGQILLGTQMLAKGHHFPDVTLVAILDVDSGLYSADFRASERMAQLIVQVSGRAGREAKAGRVLLQTRNPDNPLLQVLLREGYMEFAKHIANEREIAQFPPYAHMAVLRADASDPAVADAFLDSAKTVLNKAPNKVSSFGPIPAPLARKADRYRAQLILQSSERRALHSTLNELMGSLYRYRRTKHLRWSLDVDPLELY